MKKGYYIHFQGRTSIGVSKKIDMQIMEFSKYYDIREIEVETRKRSLVQRIIGLFPCCSIKRDYETALNIIQDPEFLYIRRTVADRDYISFLRRIKAIYPYCKIIIEVFTYPYDKDEFKKWNAWPFYFKEIIYRRRLKEYVERLVVYTEEKTIFGIPTICTMNGVDIESVSPVEGEYQENSITMIGVAYMQKKHGYERIIEGMKDYYRSGAVAYKIKLLLVGDGPQRHRYLELVQKYGLEEYIKFYPVTTGKQLDELYNKSDLALVAFGLYRIGFYGKISSLKVRECLAKGLPILTGSEIDVLDNNYKYMRVYPNTSERIDMFDVISFYESIREIGKSKKDVMNDIREYAIQHVSMGKAMQPIINYIEDNV